MVILRSNEGGDSMQQHDEQQQYTIERIQDASRKLQSASTQEERNEWAQKIRAYSEELTGQSNKTALTVEAQVPSSSVLPDLTRQVEQSFPGVRSIEYRRDQDGQGRIKVQATKEALPRAKEMLQTFGQHVERAFSSTSS